jgi:hypothetical protein
MLCAAWRAKQSMDGQLELLKLEKDDTFLSSTVATGFVAIVAVVVGLELLIGLVRLAGQNQWMMLSWIS